MIVAKPSNLAQVIGMARSHIGSDTVGSGCLCRKRIQQVPWIARWCGGLVASVPCALQFTWPKCFLAAKLLTHRSSLWPWKCQAAFRRWGTLKLWRVHGCNLLITYSLTVRLFFVFVLFLLPSNSLACSTEAMLTLRGSNQTTVKDIVPRRVKRRFGCRLNMFKRHVVFFMFFCFGLGSLYKSPGNCFDIVQIGKKVWVVRVMYENVPYVPTLIKRLPHHVIETTYIQKHKHAQEEDGVRVSCATIHLFVLCVGFASTT